LRFYYGLQSECTKPSTRRNTLSKKTDTAISNLIPTINDDNLNSQIYIHHLQLPRGEALDDGSVRATIINFGSAVISLKAQTFKFDTPRDIEIRFEEEPHRGDTETLPNVKIMRVFAGEIHYARTPDYETRDDLMEALSYGNPADAINITGNAFPKRLFSANMYEDPDAYQDLEDGFMDPFILPYVIRPLLNNKDQLGSARPDKPMTALFQAALLSCPPNNRRGMSNEHLGVIHHYSLGFKPAETLGKTTSDYISDLVR